MTTGLGESVWKLCATGEMVALQPTISRQLTLLDKSKWTLTFRVNDFSKGLFDFTFSKNGGTEKFSFTQDNVFVPGGPAGTAFSTLDQSQKEEWLSRLKTCHIIFLSRGIEIS